MPCIRCSGTDANGSQPSLDAKMRLGLPGTYVWRCAFPCGKSLNERHIPLGLWCLLRPNRMPGMTSPPKLCAVKLLPDVVRLQVSERGSRPGKALLQRPPGTTSSKYHAGTGPKHTKVMELNSDRPSRAPLTARLAGRSHFRRH